MNEDQINEAERLITHPLTTKSVIRLLAHELLLELREERKRCENLRVESTRLTFRRAFEDHG